MVDIGKGLDSAKEKLDDKLDSAIEGVGAVKEKIEDAMPGAREEGEEIET
ncbi:MAG: hypothetical protein OXE44_02980 [Nitrospinae bacterium]|nr:hypothetical protein [Nitrospinota bacterium]